MPDVVDSGRRAQMMSGIKSRDTRPELIVRRWLHVHGFRYRLHRADLPGRPDVVLPRFRTAIFVNGCFWHRHSGCRLAYIPKSREQFWTAKFETNVARDQRVMSTLTELGWSVDVVWECETRGPDFDSRMAMISAELRRRTKLTNVRVPSARFPKPEA